MAVLCRIGLCTAAIGEQFAEPSWAIRSVVRLQRAEIDAVLVALGALPYDDVLDAQRRLVAMFGFEPGPVARHPDGSVAHAVVLAGTGFVHLHPPAGDVVPSGPADGRRRSWSPPSGVRRPR